MNLANCAAFNLPASDFDDCNPEINYSEIERIFISGPQSAAFADITAVGEWTTRLQQTTVGPNIIRALTVIGDKPAAASVIKELSNGRKKAIGKDHTLPYTIDDISAQNYSLFLILEQNPMLRLFGFETQGGKMYHYGNAGILVNNDANVILPRGRDEIERIDGTISWRGWSPLRSISPIFSGSAGTGDTTPVTFDTSLTFASSVSDDEASVGGTAAATDADLKLEFDAIATPAGTPNSMEIRVSGTAQLVVDYPSDYAGQAFRFTDTSGVTHDGTFTNGQVNF